MVQTTTIRTTTTRPGSTKSGKSPATSREMDQLTAEVRAMVLQKEALEARIEQSLERINLKRDAAAAETAKRLYSIVPGTFVRYGGSYRSSGGIVQVLKVGADYLFEDSFNGRKIQKKELARWEIRATCARLHKGTGKPIESRRKWGHVEGEPNYETVDVVLSAETVIVPPEEVVPKRQKAEKSEALKALGKLSPEKLAELVKKAKV